MARLTLWLIVFAVAMAALGVTLSRVTASAVECKKLGGTMIRTASSLACAKIEVIEQ